MNSSGKNLERTVADIQFTAVNYVILVMQHHRRELLEFLHPFPIAIRSYIQQQMEKEVGHLWTGMTLVDRRKTIAFAMKYHDDGMPVKGHKFVWEDGDVVVEEREDEADGQKSQDQKTD